MLVKISCKRTHKINFYVNYLKLMCFKTVVHM